MKHRTNIELEMDYVERIMRRYGLATKTAAVDLALRRLAGEIPTSTERVLELHGFDPDFEVPQDEIRYPREI